MKNEDTEWKKATAASIVADREDARRAARMSGAAPDLYAALRWVVFAYAAQNDVENDAQLGDEQVVTIRVSLGEVRAAQRALRKARGEE